jgi:hypothetical protein
VARPPEYLYLRNGHNTQPRWVYTISPGNFAGAAYLGAGDSGLVYFNPSLVSFGHPLAKASGIYHHHQWRLASSSFLVLASLIVCAFVRAASFIHKPSRREHTSLSLNGDTSTVSNHVKTASSLYLVTPTPARPTNLGTRPPFQKMSIQGHSWSLDNYIPSY